jgi:tetratricopeptide (TPR) repeat protein
LFYLRTKQPDRAGQKLAAIPDPQRQAFHYELIGMTAAQSGKLPDAEDAYKKALQKEPNRGTTQQLLFDQYVRSKRFDEAIHLVDDQIKKTPANSDAIAMRGNLYDLQGKTAEAKQNYEQALQNDPTQFLAANNLAYLLADQDKDLDTALKYAQVARSKRPEDPSIADTLGWVYYKLKRPVLARDSAQFALSKQPDNPIYQYHLGMIYKSANQRNEAEAVLKKAVANPVAFKEKSDAEDALKDIDHWRHLTGSGK